MSPQFLAFIDAHIHLDHYPAEQRIELLSSLGDAGIESVIAVSMNLASCETNLQLAQKYPRLIHPAFGFHPEQPLPSGAELDRLFAWMKNHLDAMIAVGEVGLPYYSRLEAAKKGDPFSNAPYEELLERFIHFAKKHDKPIVLHAVYEDADVACDLLERYSLTQAHFHWFKGSAHTMERMASNGYYISFTPDLLYEEEIQTIARQYPPGQLMAETDGPWPFEGPFTGQPTHPRMTHEVVRFYRLLMNMDEAEAQRLFYENTKRFYHLSCM